MNKSGILVPLVVAIVVILAYAIIIRPMQDRKSLIDCLNKATSRDVETYIISLRSGTTLPTKEDCYEIYK